MKEKQAKEFEKLDDNSDLFEWLDNNGFHEKALHGFECNMFFSLLQDFCFFIYESLSCAARGKITVAYSLLRKPIRDNLFYLEWLLADKDDFYQCFMNNNIEKCDISSKDFTLERKRASEKKSVKSQQTVVE